MAIYIQRVRISSVAGTSSSNGRKKSAAKMFENAIDQCAPGANDQSPASTTMPMQYRMAPAVASQRAVRTMTRVSSAAPGRRASSGPTCSGPIRGVGDVHPLPVRRSASKEVSDAAGESGHERIRAGRIGPMKENR